MILQLTPTGGSTLTLVNDGASTGYDLLMGASFGAPLWDHQFSGQRGTQGARPSQGTLPNRQVTLPLRVTGSTKDNLAVKLSDLAETVDQLRRFGGICRLKSKDQTRAQRFEVLTATNGEVVWDNRFELLYRAAVGVTLNCGPYVLGDPMDISDGFSTDNVNGGELNYTADAGALTNVAVTGGVLDASGNLTTENRLVFTGNGYTYGDHEATVLFSPGSTITSFKAGVLIKRIDASNYLAVYVDDNGTNSRLRVDKVVATVTTNLSSTNLGARVANGVYAWVRGRIEANTVFAEYFLGNVVPNPTVAPTTSASVNLTTGEAATFGLGVEGRSGIVFTPQQTAAFLDDFEVLPFTYRNPPPYALDCYGAIPGDAPALGSVRLGFPSGVSPNASWGMFGWARRSAVENFVRNGDFGSDPNSTTNFGWSVAAVSGVTGAATSITAISDDTLGVAARYGEFVGQLVTPATANTGATYAMYQRFRAGVTYNGTLWVRASSGSTTVRIRLGVSGDIQSSSAVALSTTWTQHTVSWTPTTSVDLAYLAVEVTAATATTFQIDGAAVYAGATAPALGGQLEGAGAASPLSILRAQDWFHAETLSSDASANGGTLLTSSADVAFTTFIDPGLIDSEDYTAGSVSFAVYGRVRLDSTMTAVTATILALPPSAGSSIGIFTPEHGSAGRRITTPSSGSSKYRMTRLGTLTIPRRATGTRLQFSVTVAITTGSGTIGVDDVYLVPLRSHFAWPTEKVGSSGYPIMLLATEGHRTVEADLSSSVTTQASIRVAGGAGGALVEIMPGQLRILGMASSMVPDDPTASSTSETQAFPSTHVSVTPRWHWLRDA